LLPSEDSSAQLLNSTPSGQLRFALATHRNTGEFTDAPELMPTRMFNFPPESVAMSFFEEVQAQDKKKLKHEC